MILKGDLVVPICEYNNYKRNKGNYYIMQVENISGNHFNGTLVLFSGTYYKRLQIGTTFTCLDLDYYRKIKYDKFIELGDL